MSDILITDDERDIRELIADILEDEGYGTRLAGNSDDCMAAISEAQPALMILDIWLKDSQMDGIDILKTVKRDYPDIPVVIISGHGNIEIAVAAIKQGAYDFIEKPFNIDQLLVVIRRAMEASQLRRENVALKRRDASPSEMLGDSAAFRTMIAQLDKVTKSNGRVMLSGGAGTGKELAARYIHEHSNRARAPFVVANCTGMTEEEAEAHFFGVEGRDGQSTAGVLEQADGGVLYLDEVTEIPLAVQARLLRTLVDNKVQRVGGTEKTAVDIRIVSGSSRDLLAAIEARSLREELYHRLNVVPVTVPALEDRREDIPLLAQHFITQGHEAQGLAMRKLSEDSIALMQTMTWPGNVRQLKNLMERVLILGEGTAEIEPRELEGEGELPEDDGRVVISGALATLPLREAREAFEREYLLTQINRFGGNISKTASFVGMERSALHRKLKSLGVVTSNKTGARVARVENAE